MAPMIVGMAKLRHIPDRELRRMIRAAEAELGPTARTTMMLRRELERRASCPQKQKGVSDVR